MQEESKIKTISPQAGFQENFVRSNADVVIGGGVLNPQPLDSKIITPNGVRTMGEIEVGDYVCDIHGGKQLVTMTIDRGMDVCVQFVLNDGRKVESSLKHHWLIVDNKECELNLSTQEIIEHIDRGYEDLRIPNVKKVCINGHSFTPKECIGNKYSTISSYNIVGKKHIKCIQVSGDEHLYLTDGYVITRNCGKAQPLESKILTPQGWTTMGNLKVGDEISSTNGGTQRVLNIFERGMLDCLKFEFEDGTSVECCDEHLWTVWDKKNTQYKTIEAKEIVKNGIGRYSLPIIEPVNMTKKELPLDPYFLGVLIGDGCLGLYGTCITLTTDLEIIERVRKENDFDSVMVKSTKYPACRFNGKAIRDILRKLGLFGHHSYSKFIPKEYLYSSIEDRKRLLQGLLDTDGYNYTSSSRIEFCTTSEQLAKDVVILVKSLGGKVFLSTKIGSYKKDNVRHFCNKAWRLICRFDNPNDMFTIERKRNGIPSKGTFRTNIAKVERIGKKEMRCILVSDENHLYITDGMNPTHNSFAAILSIAAPSLDPNFRACFIRRTFTELKSGGGLTDDFTVAYGSYVQMKNSEPPRANFPSGSFVEFRQINDENIKKVTEGWKGSQYDLIYLDELTSYEFSTFKYLLSRNRGKAKWTGKFRGTTNPEKDCWVRAFIDWYIGPDGQIREDRNGVVRYFYIKGDSVDSVIWGNSKEEVYSQCKIDIDRKLKALGGDFTYENMIKSFTFYLGRMSENKASIGNNKDYAGSVASVGGKQARQLIEGNWNVSLRDNGDLPIPEGKAEQVFMNDPCMNNDKWITADLADSGTDNTVIFVWNGLHVMDYSILCKSTPRMNVERIQYMANKYDIPNEHIIYDAIRAPYVVDYIDDTMPFFSYHRTMGKYGLMYRFLKDECYARLCEVIKRDMLSFDDNVAQTIYEHQKLTTPITIKEEFIEECSVVQFKTMPGGKKALLNKKEMNSHLGKKRSMDVLDPCAMRMYPLLEFEYGQELTQTEVRVAEDSEGDGDCDIYDESTWS